MAVPTYVKATRAYATADSAVPPLLAVVRLYEKTLSHLGRARIELQSRRFEPFFHEIDKALTIMAGLDSILDMKRDTDVALELHRFYVNMMRLSGVIAARRDPLPMIDRIIAMWSKMLDAWRTVAAERGGGHSPSGSIGQTTARVRDREIEESCTRSISILG